MGYPNDAERRRLEHFPDRIPVEDLRACFALSDRDRVLIFEQRGPENRLGLAVSLCALRYVVADETAVARVAPVTHAHVNSLGRYDVHRQPPPAGHLRPLRQDAAASAGSVLTPPLGVSGDKH